MKDGIAPDPNKIFPVPGCDTVTYVRPTVTDPNIIVGDFTYFSDVDFEKHVIHHYAFNGDKLITGKSCQIAAGATFVMNGADHQMNAVSTFPFYIMEGWIQEAPPYTIVAGDPAREIRERFDDDLIELMLRLRWWDKPIEEIDRLIPLLSCGDLSRVRAELTALLEEQDDGGADHRRWTWTLI